MSGITNPAEEYFKDGLWGWAATVWEKLVSSGGRLFTALHGWDGDSWQKLPLVWGFSEIWRQYVVESNVAAGDHSVAFTSPEAGEIFFVLGMHAWNEATVNTRIEITLATESSSAHLACKVSPPTYEGVRLESSIILQVGDVLRADFTGCALNDDPRIMGWGYKMKIVA